MGFLTRNVRALRRKPNGNAARHGLKQSSRVPTYQKNKVKVRITPTALAKAPLSMSILHLRPSMIQTLRPLSSTLQMRMLSSSTALSSSHMHGGDPDVSAYSHPTVAYLISLMGSFPLPLLHESADFTITTTVQCVFPVALYPAMMTVDVGVSKTIDKEKARNLAGTQDSSSPHKEHAPGWNEHLAVGFSSVLPFSCLSLYPRSSIFSKLRSPRLIVCHLRISADEIAAFVVPRGSCCQGML